MGAGTGRDDVVVIDAVGAVPFTSPPALDQEASWKIEQTSDSGQPVVTNERTFQVASLNGGSNSVVTGSDGGGGSSGIGSLFLLLLVARLRRRLVQLNPQWLINKSA